jgi:hypothetical protein
MLTYRCFFLGRDGRIFDADTADHPDDDAACGWGERLMTSHKSCIAVEIWQMDRRVGRYDRTPMTARR